MYGLAGKFELLSKFSSAEVNHGLPTVHGQLWLGGAIVIVEDALELELGHFQCEILGISPVCVLAHPLFSVVLVWLKLFSVVFFAFS